MQNIPPFMFKEVKEEPSDAIWNSMDIYPGMGANILVEDHEGNWALAYAGIFNIFFVEYAVLGIPVKWAYATLRKGKWFLLDGTAIPLERLKETDPTFSLDLEE